MNDPRKSTPPRLPLRFFRWFCHPDYVEDIEGDLLERYHQRIDQKGLKAANRWFFVSTIKLLRFSLIRPLFSRQIKFKSVLYDQVRSSVRIMSRQKLYTAVILMSLLVGLTLSHVLIAFLVKTSDVDHHISERENIYRLLTDDPFEPGKKIAYMSAKSGEYLIEHYPDFKEVCRLYFSSASSIGSGVDKVENPTVLGVDADFLTFFEFELLVGSHDRAIRQDGVVISQKMARRLFGYENPMGRLVEINSEIENRSLLVTGVIDLDSYNSHLKFDAIVFQETLQARYGGLDCYLKFFDNSDTDRFMESISNDSEMPTLWGKGPSPFYLQNLKEVHFDLDNLRDFSTGISRQLVFTGWTVTMLILLISGLNFVNLFLLSSIKRRKEMGIKKVLGVSIATLRSSLFVDITIYLLLAFFLSFLISIQLVPVFNYQFDASLIISDLWQGEVLGLFGFILLLIAFLSVIYSFGRLKHNQPIRMLSNPADFKVRLNKYLLSPQFMVSIALAIVTSFIIRQIDYIKQKPLGFDRKLIELVLKDTERHHQLQQLKNAALERGIVAYATLCSGNPISGNLQAGYDLPNGSRFSPFHFSGDSNMIKTYGIALKVAVQEGLDGYYVNEALVRYFNWKDPVGQRIPGVDKPVSGVFHDFNMVSLYEKVPPAIINIENNRDYSRIILNYRDRSLLKVLTGLEDLWHEFVPGVPFAYKVVNDELLKKHKDDTKLLNIVMSFACGGILITCFGLFALSWAITQNRTKEVGIRKVMGASVKQIVRLLSIDFLKWVVMAFFIAIPVAYWLVDKWFQNFAYHTSISPSVFVVVGLVVLILSGIIVGFHAAKAAWMNPVNSLRDE